MEILRNIVREVRVLKQKNLAWPESFVFFVFKRVLKDYLNNFLIF